MFSSFNINGSTLPDKTLCLTFDDGPGDTLGDGPGSKTIRIAEYLASEGIYATFFMVGKHIVQYPTVVPAVFEMGHIVGNHAFCHHLRFTDLYKAKYDYIIEIEFTSKLIGNNIRENNMYVRAPWGDISIEVINELNEKLNDNLNYIGPFVWDMGGADVGIWEHRGSADKCFEYYMSELNRTNHGIVLMHDSTADLLIAKQNNLAFETLKILIPELKCQGYKFVNLDVLRP